jgi:hypothetical protein
MIEAKTIVNDKFWILRDGGRKVGELNLEQEGYRVKTVRGTRHFNNIDAVRAKGIVFDNIKIQAGKQSATDVEGYPALGTVHNPVWDVQKRLPLYTKDADSKSMFAAGWYNVTIKGRTKKMFCPKLIILERNEYEGPFVEEPGKSIFYDLFE